MNFLFFELVFKGIFRVGATLEALFKIILSALLSNYGYIIYFKEFLKTVVFLESTVCVTTAFVLVLCNFF